MAVTNTISPNPYSPPPPDKINAIHLEEASPLEDVKFAISKDADTALALFENADQLHEALDPEEEKRLVRKIDFMIIPYLAVCYAFYYIDKTTLSYAAIFGIKDDLKLVGTQYSWLSSVFYFGWLIWAFPTNFMIQRFPVGKYLGVNIFLWGFFLMCQAAVRNFTQLVVLRVLGGMVEAVSDPAFMIITSMWYTRKQQPVRIGLWYTANGCGIALGGLLGYAIGHIKGSLPSWKYEFIIIGALCCCWGIVMFIFLPDSPVTAKGLSQRERRMAVERRRQDQTGIENKHLKPYQVWEALTDWKCLLFFVLGTSANIPNGGISNFGTLIIKGFGFSTLGTTLLQMPYGAFIALMILTCVFVNDRLPGNKRCMMIIIFLLPNIAGAFGLAFLDPTNKGGRLTCYYLTGSYNASFVLILSILTGNVGGHTKKVVSNAMIFLGVCTGNIAGPFFYKTDQAPQYTLGIWSMVVSHLVELSLIIVLWVGLAWENRRRDRIQGVANMSEEEKAERRRELDNTAFTDMTDKENLNFRYVY